VYLAKARAARPVAQAQEPSYLHGLAEEPDERIAPGILKQQHGPPVFAHKRQWPNR